MEKRIRELLNQGLSQTEVRDTIFKEYANVIYQESDRFEIASMVRDIDNQ